MKYFLPLLVLFCLGNSAAAQTIQDALKNPATVNSILLNGQANEAKLLTANASKFVKLDKIVISNINDSIQAEQAILAAAACPAVERISFQNCGFVHLSGAIRMLTNVYEVKISACDRLEADQAFTVLSEMPGLIRLEYETQKFSSVPRSFMRLRTLDEIKIVNRDLSLADGYALNTKSPAQVYSEKSSELGFGDASLLITYACYDAAYASAHLSVMRDMLQGTIGSTGEMPLIKRAQAFTRNHPLVKAPVAGLDVQKNVYETSAESGGMIEYPSGTKINIPANAFVDAAGNPVTGNVTIDYREFRDHVDILLSGIPMKYDSAGQSGDFKSAGMFEINASVNGEEVFLAPGKTINMDFAVVDTASTYNFYELDEKKGWVYREKPGAIVTQEETGTEIETDEESAIPLSQAVEFYRRKISYNRIASLGDTTSFDDRYLDSAYYYEDKKGTSYFKKNGKTRRQTASKVYLRKTRTKKDHVLFVIARSYTGKHIVKNHTELSAFGGIYWRLNGHHSSLQFKNNYGKKKAINDFRVYYEGETDFTIELKDATGFQQLSVSPVRLNSEGKEIPLTVKESYRLNRLYQRMLNNRRRVLNRTNGYKKRSYFRSLRKMQPDTAKVWRHTRPFMNQDERDMQFEEWKAYVLAGSQRLQSAVGKLKGSTDNVLRSLQLDGFGIYNCDQIQRLSNPVEVFAVLEDSSGKRLPASVMYVVDRNINSVLSFGAWGEGRIVNGAISIAYSPGSDNRLIGVEGNTLYIAGNAAFENENTNHGKKVFVVQRLPRAATVGEVRAAMFGPGQ